jgi:small subunit ribosomal protein S19e
MENKTIVKNPVYDLSAQEYNLKLAEALKSVEEYKVPEWIPFVKSGVSRKRPIQDEDFWFKRAASILRNIYRSKTVGVNRLRTKYGGKQDRGSKPEKFTRASGKIIRKILQQSDEAGFTEIVKSRAKGKRSGRILTEKGKKFLESIN